MNSKTGEVGKDKDGYRMRFERVLPYPIDVVWNAITDPEKIRIWFTDIEMDFEEGGKMKIWFRDEQRTESPGRILKIAPPNLFVYNWEDELAEWELISTGEKTCKLIFTYSKVPDSYARSVPAGWHIILDQLETVLDGHQDPYPFGGEQTPEGKQMQEVYRKIFDEKFPELKS